MSQSEITKAKILVVDDDSLNLMLIEEVLSDENFSNAVYFDKSIEAIKHAENETVDLILLDLKMPVMDGYAFMEKLSTFNKSCPPILILTASADEDTLNKVREAGAQGVISKPFEFDEVIGSIKKLIRSHWSFTAYCSS